MTPATAAHAEPVDAISGEGDETPGASRNKTTRKSELFTARIKILTNSTFFHPRKRTLELHSSFEEPQSHFDCQ